MNDIYVWNVFGSRISIPISPRTLNICFLRPCPTNTARFTRFHLVFFELCPFMKIEPSPKVNLFPHMSHLKYTPNFLQIRFKSYEVENITSETLLPGVISREQHFCNLSQITFFKYIEHLIKYLLFIQCMYIQCSVYVRALHCNKHCNIKHWKSNEACEGGKAFTDQRFGQRHLRKIKRLKWIFSFLHKCRTAETNSLYRVVTGLQDEHCSGNEFISYSGLSSGCSRKLCFLFTFCSLTDSLG